ncbi:MAG: DUF2149 domain-containing protein [Solirubrobacterales bacterium]|nr:DUF2149 domain-containing protein [Solirubrobacterales bacterium]
MSRTGLGRHGQLDSDAGDPLDGLVNLFDLGIVLAIGFLVAGLSIAMKHNQKSQAKTSTQGTSTQAIKQPSNKQTSGSGHSVGQVYQLPNGKLVLVRKK